MFDLSKFWKKDTSTNFKRWSKLKNSWDDRIVVMARFIKPNSSVLDLGCGVLALKKYLPQDCSYQPCDVVSRDETTIVCDFNKNEFPPFKKYDYIFCSGLLEYVNDLSSFMMHIASYSDRMVVSYAVKIEDQTIAQREKLDWVNHFNRQQFEDIMRKPGFKIMHAEDWKKQRIYYLERAQS